MRRSVTHHTNHDLFSNHYLDEHLPETEAWNEVDDDELRAVYDGIVDLYEREKGTASKRNESQLEETFIRPIFRTLGIPFEVEERTSRTRRRPDYGFFETEQAGREAFDRRESGGDFYENAVAVADAKRWGRPLDTRGSNEHERDFENPSYQIHVYLQETPARWAVLTDGKTWRLYYGPTSHRLDSYYEVDLPTVLAKDDLEAFKYFYLFFRHGAFLEDADGECFLDDVYGQSNVFARELGEDLQNNIYEAIKVLSEGYLQYPENDLDEADLGLIHDSSLIYLYRLIFVLYAEAEGRDLLDTDNEIYEESYSLNSLKQEVAEELDSGDPNYRNWQDELSSRLEELFELIDQGSDSRGIPEEDLHIPAYNGGLFRTDPDGDDGAEAQFLAEHTVGDAYLARVVELLTRSRQAGGDGKTFVDYSSLDVRHLGSIYEGLLEYQLNVADGPLALDDGEYVDADEGDDVAVGEGAVYLTTESGERKATGSYYTPEYIVEYILENTLGPLVDNIRKDLAGQTAHGEGGFAGKFADRIFELKVLDPAMGSGHFLTNAVDYLAREIIDAQERQAAQGGVETVDGRRDINWARREVAQQCLYGVDLNPLAVELAKVSLWLRTLAAEQPLVFLDHHLKTGNSLVGSDIETVLGDGGPDTGSEEGQLTLSQSFDRTRRQALEQVTDRFEDLLAIDNETLDDIKEMEAVYEQVREDPLYQRLIAMANVHTAEGLGLELPADAYERMAEALRDDSWADIERREWYRSAQRMADDRLFFHWDLEFPIAFYGQDGERRANRGGFDAIIGNPPWAAIRGKHASSMFDAEEVEYLQNKFPENSYMPNAYEYSVETSLERLTEGGRHSFIVPDRLGFNSNLAYLRDAFLSEYTLESLVYKSPFPEVIADTLIYVLKNTSPRENYDLTVSVYGNDAVSVPVSFYRETGDKAFLYFENEGILKAITNIECNVSHSISEYAETTSGVGGKSDEITETKTNDEQRPIIKGADIDRYVVSDYHYFEFVDENITGRTRDTRKLGYAPKVVLPKTGARLNAAIEEDGVFPEQSVYFLYDLGGSVSPRVLLSIINSKVFQFYYSKKMVTNRGSTPQLKKLHLDRFPLPDVSRTDYEKRSASLAEHYSSYISGTTDTRGVRNCVANERELLGFLSRKMTEHCSERSDLNLNVLDYLGAYDEGESIADTEGIQPAQGVGGSVLTQTTTDLENLRISGVTVRRDGRNPVLYATCRYKPTDESEFETDRWGYTETDPVPGFELTDLSAAEETLLEAFVPVIVEKADGFAVFRANATKTNSPLDRLKAITLPAPDAVAEDIRRYIDVRDRAESLDEKIERTDRLIDEIVYDLYELTDEAIGIIESAVDTD